MAKDMIKELSALDDAALSAKLGFDDKLEILRSDLARADKLSGKARDSINSELKRMFSPTVYPGDLSYSIERAEKKDACGPAEVVACCGDCGPEC